MIWPIWGSSATGMSAAIGACVVVALIALPVALAVRVRAREGAKRMRRARLRPESTEVTQEDG